MTVELSLHDGVATIALNRPEVRNALNLEMCEALIDAIEKAKETRLENRARQTADMKQSSVRFGRRLLTLMRLTP